MLSRFQRLVRLERAAQARRSRAPPRSLAKCERDRIGSDAHLWTRPADVVRENPTLLGGVRITVGSDVYDGSVQGPRRSDGWRNSKRDRG